MAIRTHLSNWFWGSITNWLQRRPLILPPRLHWAHASKLMTEHSRGPRQDPLYKEWYCYTRGILAQRLSHWTCQNFLRTALQSRPLFLPSPSRLRGQTCIPTNGSPTLIQVFASWFSLTGISLNKSLILLLSSWHPLLRELRLMQDIILTI